MWSKFGYADTWNCLYIKHNYVYRVSKKNRIKRKSHAKVRTFVCRSIDVFISSENIKNDQKLCLSSLCKISKNRSHWNISISMQLMWSEFGYADAWNCMYIKHNYVYRVSKKIKFKVKSCKG